MKGGIRGQGRPDDLRGLKCHYRQLAVMVYYDIIIYLDIKGQRSNKLKNI